MSTDFQKLERCGIHIITGERDAFSLRALCHVTENGKKMLEAYFDCKMTMRSVWGQNGKYEVMLGMDFLYGKFVPYLYLKEGARYVARHFGNQDVQASDWTPYSQEEWIEHKKIWDRLGLKYRVYENPNMQEYNRPVFG